MVAVWIAASRPSLVSRIVADGAGAGRRRPSGRALIFPTAEIAKSLSSLRVGAIIAGTEKAVFAHVVRNRGCGRTFCDDCTTKRFELPASFKAKGKQRVCDDCYYLLVQVLRFSPPRFIYGAQLSADSNPDQFPPKPGNAHLNILNINSPYDSSSSYSQCKDVEKCRTETLERIKAVLR